MVQTLVPIAMFVCVAYMVVALARIISDGSTRRRLLEKGATPEQVAAMVARPKDAGLTDALRWGLLVGAVGIALIIIQFIPFGPEEPVSLGLVLLFGAAGLLAYYALARRLHVQG